MEYRFGASWCKVLPPIGFDGRHSSAHVSIRNVIWQPVAGFRDSYLVGESRGSKGYF
jgi:hypothetical protein